MKICDNITGKRLSPEAVQIARQEELEFMDKLAVLKEVPVEQCWLETNANPIGATTTQAIEIESSELKVHAGKDIRLFYHGDDFVVTGNEAFDREDLWSAGRR